MSLHNRTRNEAKRSSVELRSLVDSILFFWSLLDSMLPPHRPRDSSVIVFSVQGHRIIDRCLPSLTRNSGWRRPPWPCFYPHSEWAATGPGASWGSIYTQVHHDRDGPGLVGCCHLLGDLGWTSPWFAVTRTRRWMSSLAKSSPSLVVFVPPTPVCSLVMGHAR